MTSTTEESGLESTVTPKKTHKRTNSQIQETHKKDHAAIEIPLSSDLPAEPAIKLESTYKTYGSGKSKTQVLIGLNMEVPKGQIYGLLGPSGCGKTTLLKCIVGKLKVDSGSLNVFGEPPGPGSKSGVPGARVGYMPQELALFLEFSIEETLIYFARIYGMTRAKFKERLIFLMDFLDLPSSTRILENMSGGQQRRASLAVALLHEPELLILDEPTVGVDPILRTTIWKHLVAMSKPDEKTGKSTTIVITTHYIEEAIQSNRVGMMRSGKLLDEGAPNDLLEKYNKPNLEDVFLGLCQKDGDVETAGARESRKNRPPIVKKSGDNCKNEESLIAKFDDKSNSGVQIVQNGLVKHNNNDSKRNTLTEWTPEVKNMKAKKVRACMLKTFNRMRRRVGFLIYQFVMPALQVSLFCLAIGQDPKNLPIAIVNAENNGAHCFLPLAIDDDTYQCPITFSEYLGLPEPNKKHLVNFTCRYMSFVDENVVSPMYFDNMASAEQSVRDGETWGILAMDGNFSKNLYDRIIEGSTEDLREPVDMDFLNRSSINVKMDMTNQHIAFTLQMKFVEAFEAFTKQIFRSCGIPEERANIPLVFQDPIYGSKEMTFTDFMAPGIIMTIVHSMALGYSAMIIIMERTEGLLDRTWIAGVTPGEFALAHFLVSLVVNLLQVAVTLVFMILIFQVPAEGSLFWVFVLTMLQGICGTTIGLVISSVCRTQQDATQVALGIFYPNLILSGIIWPVEAMPVALRYVAYVLPQTFAVEAIRGILLRGWGLSYMPVYRGFLVTIAWIIVTFAAFKKIVMNQG